MIWFGCWIGFGVEIHPYGLLRKIVSVEAIFLSTFVMIGKSQTDAKRQAIADQQRQTVEEQEDAVTTARSAEVEPALHEASQTQSRARARNRRSDPLPPLTGPSASGRPSTRPS